MDKQKSHLGRIAAYQYSTAAAIEEPIKPAVNVEHTKLFINGQFVDAASGKYIVTLIECSLFPYQRWPFILQWS